MHNHTYGLLTLLWKLSVTGALLDMRSINSVFMDMGTGFVGNDR